MLLLLIVSNTVDESFILKIRVNYVAFDCDDVIHLFQNILQTVPVARNT